MCGIAGGVSESDITLRLAGCLGVLEHHGYDFSNLVIMDDENRISHREAISSVTDLQESLIRSPLYGKIGLANTYRSKNHTHLSDSSRLNRQMTDPVAWVMNGIIVNKRKVRTFLESQGETAHAEMDIEHLACLTEFFLKQSASFPDALRSADRILKGFFSACFMSPCFSGHLMAIRHGSSLIVGMGEHGNFVASDHLALLAIAEQFIYLEEGDIADISMSHVIIYDSLNRIVNRKIHTFDKRGAIAKKGKYSHFMLKDIFDEPDAVLSTLQGRVSEESVWIEAFGDEATPLLPKIESIQIVADDSSFHAALVGRHWMNEIAGLACDVGIATDHFYRLAPIGTNTLLVALSHSGEAREGILALRHGKSLGYIATIAISSTPESSMVRESDYAMITGEGPATISASTKIFTSQLCALFLLSMALGHYKSLNPRKEKMLVSQLGHVPRLIQRALNLKTEISLLSRKLLNKKKILFFASDIHLPVAFEGAASLSRQSRIPSNAFSIHKIDQFASMLADSEMSVIVLAPSRTVLMNHIKPILPMAVNMVIFADENIAFGDHGKTTLVRLPSLDRLLSPMTCVIPVQLLCFYVSYFKGAEIDIPYYLAFQSNAYVL